MVIQIYSCLAAGKIKYLIFSQTVKTLPGSRYFLTTQETLLIIPCKFYFPFSSCLAYLQSLSLPSMRFRRCVSILFQSLPSRTFALAHKDSCVDSLSCLRALLGSAISWDLCMLRCLGSELKQPLSVWDGKGEVAMLRNLAVILWDPLKDTYTAKPSKGAGVNCLKVHRAACKKRCALGLEKCVNEMQMIWG